MRNEIRAVVKKLKEIRIKVQGYADNCRDDEEERAEDLETEIEAIDTAIATLEEID